MPEQSAGEAGEGPNERESWKAVTLKRAPHQKPRRLGRVDGGQGEAQAGASRGEARSADHQRESSGRADLLKHALSRENMVAAWKHVKANKGSAGVDGLTIEQTIEHLRTHWSPIRAELLSETYRPQAMRRVEIPKPGGGTRELGIATVTDRLIQQALLQVLQPLIDPTFSEFNYGFRPGRSAHDAVRQAQRYAQEGFRIVVDLDLEKFCGAIAGIPAGMEAYFRLAQTPQVFRDLDSWLRHRLRAIQLKHWRRGRTIYRGLRRLGATHELAALVAGVGKRWWHCSLLEVARVHTRSYFDSLGIPRVT